MTVKVDTHWRRPTPGELDVLGARFDAAASRLRSDVYELGEMLVEAKELCDHGEWLPWLARRGVAERTAQQWMALTRSHSRAEWLAAGSMSALGFGEKSADSADFARGKPGQRGAQNALDEWNAGIREAHTDEMWTPPEITDWAAACMGGIDLDPASCAEANEAVGAARIYTAADDGLDAAREWAGRVWLNPPFNGGRLRLFCRRLLAELAEGTVTAAVMLCPQVGGSTWPDEAAAAADWWAPLRQHIKWLGPSGASGSSLAHALWGFGCEPAPITTPLVAAVFARRWA